MTLPMIHAATGLAQAFMNAKPGTYPSIIDITSRAQLRKHIKLLKPGEKLVVVFAGRHDAKSRYYRKVLFKYRYRDRGRHKFLWATGSFVRTFTKKVPRVMIASSTGRMYTISLYDVPKKLGMSTTPRYHRPLPRITPMKPPRRAPYLPPPPPPPPPPTPRPVVKPKPVVEPQPIVRPRPKQPTKVASLPGVIRFYPFGKGLFCIEVRTKSAPQLSRPTSRPQSRPVPDVASDADTDTDTEVSF